MWLNRLECCIESKRYWHNCSSKLLLFCCLFGKNNLIKKLCKIFVLACQLQSKSQKLAVVSNNSLTAVKVNQAVRIRMKDGECIDQATLETVFYYSLCCIYINYSSQTIY